MTQPENPYRAPRSDALVRAEPADGPQYGSRRAALFVIVLLTAVEVGLPFLWWFAPIDIDESLNALYLTVHYSILVAAGGLAVFVLGRGSFQASLGELRPMWVLAGTTLGIGWVFAQHSLTDGAPDWSVIFNLENVLYATLESTITFGWIHCGVLWIAIALLFPNRPVLAYSFLAFVPIALKFFVNPYMPSGYDATGFQTAYILAVLGSQFLFGLIIGWFRWRSCGIAALVAWRFPVALL